MFTNHSLIKNEDEEKLYLYVDYNFEFANFNTNNERDHELYFHVKKYINNRNVSFNGDRVFLVAGNLIFGVLIFRDNFKKYIEYIDVFHF